MKSFLKLLFICFLQNNSRIVSELQDMQIEMKEGEQNIKAASKPQNRNNKKKLIVMKKKTKTGKFDEKELIILRDETKEAFLHSYNSYLEHAFPFDELMPLSCQPR